jgi:hypothetical protein
MDDVINYIHQVLLRKLELCITDANNRNPNADARAMILETTYDLEEHCAAALTGGDIEWLASLKHQLFVGGRREANGRPLLPHNLNPVYQR